MKKVFMVAVMAVLAIGVYGCGEKAGLTESGDADAEVSTEASEYEDETSSEEVYHKSYADGVEEENATEAYCKKTEDGIIAYSEYIEANLGKEWNAEFKLQGTELDLNYAGSEFAELDVYDMEMGEYSAQDFCTQLGVHYSLAEILDEETSGNTTVQKVKIYIESSAAQSEEGMEGFYSIHYFF